MPYVPESSRVNAAEAPINPGELNYAITRLMIKYVTSQATMRGKVSYDILAETVGAATEAAAEFRRRVMAPYEELKIVENGDVYPKWMIS